MAFLAVVRIPWYGWRTIGLVTKSCCCSAAKIMSNSLLQHTRLPWLSSLTIFLSLLKLMSIESLMPSSHLILCHPLLLLASIFLSIRVLSIESALCIRWPKYWSFSFSISPSNEYSGLVSFRIDWIDLLAVQGTLKSLLQHHSSKALILWCSAFIMVQLSHLYMTAGKTTALTRRTSVQSAAQEWRAVTKRTEFRFIYVTHQMSHFIPLCLTLLFCEQGNRSCLARLLWESNESIHRKQVMRIVIQSFLWTLNT